MVTHGGLLPLLSLDIDVDLKDDLQCLLLFCDHEPDVVPREPGGQLQHLVWLGGGQQDDLGLLVLILRHILSFIPLLNMSVTL